MTTLSNPTLALLGLGSAEMLLILAILILLFGAKKLPELAKGLGKSIKEFKQASKEGEEDEVPAPKAPVKSAETTKTHSSN